MCPLPERNRARSFASLLSVAESVNELRSRDTKLRAYKTNPGGRNRRIVSVGRTFHFSFATLRLAIIGNVLWHVPIRNHHYHRQQPIFAGPSFLRASSTFDSNKRRLPVESRNGRNGRDSRGLKIIRVIRKKGACTGLNTTVERCARRDRVCMLFVDKASE